MIAFAGVRGSPRQTLEQHLHAVSRQGQTQVDGHGLTATEPELPPPEASSAWLRPIMAVRPPPRGTSPRARSTMSRSFSSSLPHSVRFPTASSYQCDGGVSPPGPPLLLRRSASGWAVPCQLWRESRFFGRRRRTPSSLGGRSRMLETPLDERRLR